MNQYPGAFDVPQKIVAETGPGVRPLNEAGDVGQNHTAIVVQLHHSQVGSQGGERIVGDLGASGADRGKQGRFTGVGDANDAHVGNELEFQCEPAFRAGFAALGNPWGLVGAGGKTGVAPAAQASPSNDNLILRFDQIGQQIF